MAIEFNDVLKIALNRIDVPGLVVDVLDDVLEPALDDLVASTETTFDDAAKAAIMPLLKPVVETKVREFWATLQPGAEEVAPAE